MNYTNNLWAWKNMNYTNNTIYLVYNKKTGILVYQGKITEVTRYVLKNSNLTNSEKQTRAYIRHIANLANRSYGGYKFRLATLNPDNKKKH